MNEKIHVNHHVYIHGDVEGSTERGGRKIAAPQSCQSSCLSGSNGEPESDLSYFPDVTSEGCSKQPCVEAQYYAGTSFPMNGWIHPCK